MQKQKNISIAVVLILAVAGSLYLIVKSESAKITIFEECVKAGWLVSGIKMYDGFGPIEAECALWSGKSFVKQRSGASQQTERMSSVTQGNWETKTDDQPPVTIKVTPVEFGKGAKTWKFQAVFDTHSGSLDDDLLAAVSLVDNKGSAYQPISWEGPGPGGHHREGVLAFEAVNPAPSYAELKIKNVGGVSERLFKWNMQ